MCVITVLCPCKSCWYPRMLRMMNICVCLYVGVRACTKINSLHVCSVCSWMMGFSGRIITPPLFFKHHSCNGQASGVMPELKKLAAADWDAIIPCHGLVIKDGAKVCAVCRSVEMYVPFGFDVDGRPPPQAFMVSSEVQPICLLRTGSLLQVARRKVQVCSRHATCNCHPVGTNE